MPGITLVNYTAKAPFSQEQEKEIVTIIHDIIQAHTGKRPAQSEIDQVSAGTRKSFVDLPGKPLSASGVSYFLIVDGEKNRKTKRRQQDIHAAIKKDVGNLLGVHPATFRVRYRLFVSKFG